MLKQLPIRLAISVAFAAAWGSLARDWLLAANTFVLVFLITASRARESPSKKLQLATLTGLTAAVTYLFIWVGPHRKP